MVEPVNGEGRLVDLYNQYFEVVAADTDELREEVFRMRFHVLAVEHNYFNPDFFPNGMETDEFDEQSVHYLLRHRPTQGWAGTVRVVLPKVGDSGWALPIQEECEEKVLRDPTRFPALVTGEVSRLSISKNFRRRVTDSIIPDGLADAKEREEMQNRRLIPHMALGLFQAVVDASSKNDLTHTAAIMERQLLRLLGRFGIYFEEVGPLIELFGWRQPCFRDLRDLLDDVKREHREIWEIMTKEGSLTLKPNE